MLNFQATFNCRVMSAFAYQHLRAAKTFRDQAIRVEDQHLDMEFGEFFEDLRTYGSGCVMSATASLEALINELFIAPGGGLRELFNDFEKEFWSRGGVEWKPILKKYQKALQMLGRIPMSETSQVFENVNALIKLRDSLVHFKPNWDETRKHYVELETILSGRYETSPFVDAGSDFSTMKSMSAGCCRWAVSSVAEFVSEFQRSAQLSQKKMEQYLDRAVA